jgi:3-hydroxyacyl-[acyl-carrier-protein] dehydratase
VNLGPRILASCAIEHGVELELSLEANHPLLQGHFPGLPIMPGVGQLHWAIESARANFQPLGELMSLHQLKFLRLIQPGQTLRLTLNNAPGSGDVSFNLQQQGHSCASGRIRFSNG